MNKMHNVKSQTIKAAALLCAFGASTGMAYDAAQAEEWIKDVKAPCSWFSWGGDLRLRNEYLNNAFTLNRYSDYEEKDYFRFRARVWASAKVVENNSLNVRMTTEPRLYMMRNTAARGPGLDWTEGVIDNMNLRWTNIFGQGANFTVGRQDIFIGDPLDWWLVADGTPLDGSRTFYFDAARLTYTLEDAKTTFDVIGIQQFSDNDVWLPSINNQYAPVTEQNEKGAILYVANKSIKEANIDAFFMYKQDDYRIRNGRDGDLYTLGAKVHGVPMDHVKYSLEGAYQFGYRNTYDGKGMRNVSAFGMKGKASYSFDDKLKNEARLNLEYLSGDDPSTPGCNESFDLLWGRWPRWSEMFIYNVIEENRPAQIDNLIRVGPGYSISPIKNMTLTADYYALWADQGSTSASRFMGTGTFRGHYVQSILRYKFNQHVSGHLWGEVLWPGDYYVYRHPTTWFRVEFLFTL